MPERDDAGVAQDQVERDREQRQDRDLVEEQRVPRQHQPRQRQRRQVGLFGSRRDNLWGCIFRLSLGQRGGAPDPCKDLFERLPDRGVLGLLDRDGVEQAIDRAQPRGQSLEAAGRSRRHAGVDEPDRDAPAFAC